jgi:deoxyribodipyrimidine photo-lyase
METAIVVFTRDLQLRDNPARRRDNRIMNPLRQARRFDPAGCYVRRYVPELAGLDPPHTHQPWTLDAATRRRLGYPDPILEL